jgi:hypothetical protein
LQFFNKRRLYAYRSVLDGEGPKNSKLPNVYIMRTTDIGRQLDAEQHVTSEVNVMGVANLELNTMSQRMKTVSHAAMLKTHGFELVFSNVVKRLRMMIAGSELAAVRKNKKSGDTKGTSVDDSDTEPVSIPALWALVQNLWREGKFLEPEVFTPASNLMDDYLHLFGPGQKAEMDQFVASQTTMLESLAEMPHGNDDLDYDEDGNPVKRN